MPEPVVNQTFEVWYPYAVPTDSLLELVHRWSYEALDEQMNAPIPMVIPKRGAMEQK